MKPKIHSIEVVNERIQLYTDALKKEHGQESKSKYQALLNFWNGYKTKHYERNKI